MKDTTVFLNALITATSTILAVGFPFIIYMVTDYKAKRDRLQIEMSTFYPRLNTFNELIYNIFQIDFWKNKEIILKFQKTANLDEAKLLIEKYEYLSLFMAFDFFHKQHIKRIEFKKTHFNLFEINEYGHHINKIWYSIVCRTDFIREIDQESFNNIESYELLKIQKDLYKIGFNLYPEKISIKNIADISGVFEIEVVDPLKELIKSYEQPIDPKLKFLFYPLVTLFIFGLIVPLFFLIISSNFTLIVSIISAIIIFCCLSYVLYLTGRFISVW